MMKRGFNWSLLLLCCLIQRIKTPLETAGNHHRCRPRKLVVVEVQGEGIRHGERRQRFAGIRRRERGDTAEPATTYGCLLGHQERSQSILRFETINTTIWVEILPHLHREAIYAVEKLSLAAITSLQVGTHQVDQRILKLISLIDLLLFLKFK
ncbi:hypothetical protein L1987_14105 [Smallanthus sonchifolius]|uniref:Uncharacterized protein n=1 Tax=Smallanthus sonchifolius TaxID=185202 RepID=A0ACB9J3W2_9ASTR|nr:hypothetical protein L1987_14105 [Smallanthus sonchifolius]